MHRIQTQDKYDYEIALAGNPNVGKSTIFNALTGLKQHTGNWSGKTVNIAIGNYSYRSSNFKVVDLPGTYSLLPNSDEEVLASDYIKHNKFDCIVIVLDATNLMRNLNLALQILKSTNKVVVCLNLCDEADKKGVLIDIDELSLQLGVPVVKTSAKKLSGINELKSTVYKLCNNEIKTFYVDSIKSINTKISVENYISDIYKKCEDIFNRCLRCEYTSNINKLDRLINNKLIGIPIILAMLSLIFWITIFGANYFSEILMSGFNLIKTILLQIIESIEVSNIFKSFLIEGLYTTITWVIAVMLPPVAIFFPIFTLLEDSGFLPRIAFNLDRCFSKVGGHGKQSLTMAMGFGCNACAITGCRILESKRNKNIAIITNNFIPCNGRMPSLIAISSIFVAVTASLFINTLITSLILVFLIVLSVVMTMLVSLILSKTVFKGEQSLFILEIPPFRKPNIFKTIIYSLKNRALFVLLRAISVAVVAGVVIWCMTNIKFNDNTLLYYCSNFFGPFGNIIGLDGVIVLAFILGFPANEIVIPIILMSYLSTSTLTNYTSLEQLGRILINNGWNITTALCFMVLCVFHFPCSTSCITIYKETRSLKVLIFSILIPTFIGLLLCLIINSISLVI